MKTLIESSLWIQLLQKCCFKNKSEIIFKKGHSAQMNNIDKHATQSHFPNSKINI